MCLLLAWASTADEWTVQSNCRANGSTSYKEFTSKALTPSTYSAPQQRTVGSYNCWVMSRAGGNEAGTYSSAIQLDGCSSAGTQRSWMYKQVIRRKSDPHQIDYRITLSCQPAFIIMSGKFISLYEWEICWEQNKAGMDGCARSFIRPQNIIPKTYRPIITGLLFAHVTAHVVDWNIVYTLMNSLMYILYIQWYIHQCIHCGSRKDYWFTDSPCMHVSSPYRCNNPGKRSSNRMAWNPNKYLFTVSKQLHVRKQWIAPSRVW